MCALWIMFTGSHGKWLKTTNPEVERNTQNTATMNAQILRALVLTLVRLRLPVSNTGLVFNASLSAIVPILLKLSLFELHNPWDGFIQHKLQTLLAIAWPQTLALNFKVSQFLKVHQLKSARSGEHSSPLLRSSSLSLGVSEISQLLPFLEASAGTIFTFRRQHGKTSRNVSRLQIQGTQEPTCIHVCSTEWINHGEALKMLFLKGTLLSTIPVTFSSTAAGLEASQSTRLGCKDPM